MPQNSNKSDYSRYFSLQQKVCLVNMSAERNDQVYESLSGVVISSALDSVDLKITNLGPGALEQGVGSATYKLTSEALGSGIQVLADLSAVAAANIYRFQMHGAMEMFQRRSVPRVDLSTRIFQLRKNYSLDMFRKEWERVMEYMSKNGVLPGLAWRETAINLSAGGIGFAVEHSCLPTPLSMLFIVLDDDLPVCALAEAVWQKPADDGLTRCGFRFVHILKTDQERINKRVSDIIKQDGGTHLDFKRDWSLVDRMVADTRKPA